MERICVYCGSRTGVEGTYGEAAKALGTRMAQRGVGLIYGGASVGLMGVIADAALEAGGEVIGVIPQLLVDKEVAHPGLTQLHVVDGMHARKALMAELADGFIAMPGGLGTLEELFEMLTWGQLGMHAKPCGAMNVGGYYDDLVRFLDQSVSAGFVRPEHRALLTVEDEPDAMLTALERKMTRIGAGG
ncbi:MAG: TIGR00730 family Rossman fold protein [Ectothiorhodospiraceae bacterium]|nr:TIGR00730 family Rossman fold protein [Ectothiorhodospiraceae bacterium]MCH8504668.1 TIGR00730 family Rossman fold protein [Ectothiorhodospiraceae bacterium]